MSDEPELVQRQRRAWAACDPLDLERRRLRGIADELQRRADEAKAEYEKAERGLMAAVDVAEALGVPPKEVVKR